MSVFIQKQFINSKVIDTEDGPCRPGSRPAFHMASVRPAGIRVRAGVADHVLAMVGAGRDEPHAPCHQQAEKTAMMVMTVIVSISSSCVGIVVSLCRVLSTCTPSNTITGVIVRVCGRVGTAFLSGSRTSLVGKHADYGKYGIQRREKNEKGRNRFGKPLYGSHRPVPAVCLVVAGCSNYSEYRLFSLSENVLSRSFLRWAISSPMVRGDWSCWKRPCPSHPACHVCPDPACGTGKRRDGWL